MSSESSKDNVWSLSSNDFLWGCLFRKKDCFLTDLVVAFVQAGIPLGRFQGDGGNERKVKVRWACHVKELMGRSAAPRRLFTLIPPKLLNLLPDVAEVRLSGLQCLLQRLPSPPRRRGGVSWWSSFFCAEDDLIRHSLELEEKERYWRERREKLEKREARGLLQAPRELSLATIIMKDIVSRTNYCGGPRPGRLLLLL